MLILMVEVYHDRWQVTGEPVQLAEQTALGQILNSV